MALEFRTAEAAYRFRAYPGLSPAESVVARYAKGARPRGVSSDLVVPAESLEGRWVVRCPLTDPSTGRLCGGAQFASQEDPRFFCVHCRNQTAGNQWLPVIWPDDPERIEQILRVRPKENRGYLAGETIADLIAENHAHGLPVPGDGEL